MMPGRILLASDAVGGVWPYSVELAQGLARQGIGVVLAVAGPPPDQHQRRAVERLPSVHLVTSDLPLEWLARDLAELEALAAWLDRLALEHAVDLVHLNGAGVADLLTVGPVVVTHHSCLATWWQAVRGGPPPPAWRWRIARTASGLNAADMVIAPTRAFAGAIARSYRGLPPARVVPNGRSTGSAEASAEKQPLVLAAGRLWDEGKNARTLDLAAASIDWPTLALGPLEGPSGERFRPDTLTVTGALCADEVRRWMQRSAIFASLARYEPFGLAVLEAAQAGNALVLADLPTFRELWDGAALFVDPGRPEEAAAAVNRLIRDDVLRRHLAARASARAEAYPATDSVTATLALYRCLLGRRHGAPGNTSGPFLDHRERACASSSSAIR